MNDTIDLFNGCELCPKIIACLASDPVYQNNSYIWGKLKENNQNNPDQIKLSDLNHPLIYLVKDGFIEKDTSPGGPFYLAKTKAITFYREIMNQKPLNA